MLLPQLSYILCLSISCLGPFVATIAALYVLITAPVCTNSKHTTTTISTTTPFLGPFCHALAMALNPQQRALAAQNAILLATAPQTGFKRPGQYKKRQLEQCLRRQKAAMCKGDKPNLPDFLREADKDILRNRAAREVRRIMAQHECERQLENALIVREEMMAAVFEEYMTQVTELRECYAEELEECEQSYLRSLECIPLRRTNGLKEALPLIGKRDRVDDHYGDAMSPAKRRC